MEFKYYIVNQLIGACNYLKTFIRRKKQGEYNCCKHIKICFLLSNEIHIFYLEKYRKLNLQSHFNSCQYEKSIIKKPCLIVIKLKEYLILQAFEDEERRRQGLDRQNQDSRHQQPAGFHHRSMGRGNPCMKRSEWGSFILFILFFFFLFFAPHYSLIFIFCLFFTIYFVWPLF